MKKQILFIICIFSFLLILPLIMSAGPHGHTYINDRIRESSNKVGELTTCFDGGINERAFLCGSETPDISIIYYYSNGGKNYKATHNWLFQQEIMNLAVTDDERCFSYGIAQHLIVDSVFHTQIVPAKIELTKVPNAFAHPLLEKKYDSELVSDHPELMDETKHMLDGFYGEKGDRYVEMIETALGENSDINVRQEIDNLAFALDSFYNDAFKPSVKDNSWFAIYPFLDKFTNFINPVVGKWNVADLHDNTEKITTLTLNTFENWGSRYALSPHGFSELEVADSKASWIIPGVLILLILLSIVVPLVLVIKTKKFKYAFLFLLLLPILFIALAIIYILL